MVDTCIFNWLLDGDILPEDLPNGAEYFITHVQHDELSAVTFADRKSKLFTQLHALMPASAPTESTVVGISRFGAGKVSDGRDYPNAARSVGSKEEKKE